jgi:hypothetical protein
VLIVKIKYFEPIAKVISGGFAGAEVLKNCSLSGVEGKHCGLLQLPPFTKV